MKKTFASGDTFFNFTLQRVRNIAPLRGRRYKQPPTEAGNNHLIFSLLVRIEKSFRQIFSPRQRPSNSRQECPRPTTSQNLASVPGPSPSASSDSTLHGLQRFLHRRVVEITAIVLAGCALILYPRMWPDAPTLRPDSHEYLHAAKLLREWLPSTLPERTPGYPAFLLLLGELPPGRRLFYYQIALQFLSAYLVATAARRAGLRLPLVLLLLVILATPSELQTAAAVLSEPLAQFTLALGYWALSRYFLGGKKAALTLSAIAFTYGALTRPVIAPVMFLAVGTVWLAIYIWARRSPAQPSGLRLAFAFSGVPVLAMLVYSVVTLFTTNYFGITPLFAVNLGTRTADFWEQIPDPLVRELLLLKREEMRAAGLNYRWAGHDRKSLLAATGLNAVDLANYLTKIHLQLILDNPLRYLKVVWTSVFDVLMPYRYWRQVSWPPGGLLHIVWELLYFSSVLWTLLVSAVLVAVVALIRLGFPVDLADSRLSLQPVRTLLVLALTLFWSVALLSCFFDIGEPRHKAYVEIFRWLACVLALELVLRLRRGLHSSQRSG